MQFKTRLNRYLTVNDLLLKDLCEDYNHVKNSAPSEPYCFAPVGDGLD
jgi:hypothetical protein